LSSRVRHFFFLLKLSSNQTLINSWCITEKNAWLAHIKNGVMSTIYFRKLPPSGAHKSFRFEQQEDGGAWKAIKNGEIEALDLALKDKKKPAFGAGY
jgi:hypothetical protein